MQSHFGIVGLVTGLALALLVGALMIGNYFLAYGVLLSSFVGIVALLIGVSGFDGRPQRHRS
jgi:hypothetical protein